MSNSNNLKRWMFRCLKCGYSGYMSNETMKMVVREGKCPICGSDKVLIKVVGEAKCINAQR